MASLHIEIPPEVRQYQEKLVGGLTARQIIAVAVTLAVCVPLFWFGRKAIPDDVLGWIVIVVALPLGGIGFFKFNGMSAEKFLKIILYFEFLFPQKRKYRSKNAFREWSDAAKKAAQPKGFWETRKYSVYTQKSSLERAYLYERAFLAGQHGFSAGDEPLVLSENPLKKKTGKKTTKEEKEEKARRARLVLRVKKRNALMKRRRGARSVVAGDISKRIPYIADYADALFETSVGDFSKMYRVTDIPYAAFSAEEKTAFLSRFSGFYKSFPADVRIAFTIDKDTGGEKRIVFTLSLSSATPVEAAARFKFIDHAFLGNAARLGVSARVIEDEERIIYYHGKFNYGKEHEILGGAGNLRFNLATARKHNVSLKDYIAPKFMFFRDNEFLIGERWCRVLQLNNLPRLIGDTLLCDLCSHGFPVLLTLTQERVDLGRVGAVVKKQIKNTAGELTDIEKRAERIGYTAESVQHGIYRAPEQAGAFISEIIESGECLSFVSVTLLVSAGALEELDSRTRILFDTGRAYGCSVQTLSLQQDEGMKTTLPFGYVSKTLFADRALTSGLLVGFVPFWGREAAEAAEAAEEHGGA